MTCHLRRTSVCTATRMHHHRSSLLDRHQPARLVKRVRLPVTRDQFRAILEAHHLLLLALGLLIVHQLASMTL